MVTHWEWLVQILFLFLFGIQIGTALNLDEGITGWRRHIGCLKLQVIFCNRATNYRALLRKMTYKYKASYESSPPCNMPHDVFFSRQTTQKCFTWHVNFGRVGATFGRVSNMPNHTHKTQTNPCCIIAYAHRWLCQKGLFEFFLVVLVICKITHTHTYTYTHTCTHTRTHTHTHIHTGAHTHIHSINMQNAFDLGILPLIVIRFWSM